MGKNEDRIAILSLGTAVPPYQLEQEALGQWMVDSLDAEPALSRWLKSIYRNSGVKTRYACIPDFLEPPHLSRLAPGRPAAEAMTTAERMLIYERESVILGTQVGQQALTAYAETDHSPVAAVTAAVTHLIVVSCTGFFAPGLDQAIARQLNLAPTVERTMIGFMGCAAAFNGLRMATQIVKGQPSALVLVVCVELSSLHMQPGAQREILIASTLFADGASACLVGSLAESQRDVFEIGSFYTAVKPETRTEMVWQIGDHGFVLRLSPQIPEHLAEAAPVALDNLLNGHTRPHFWAIHPGGRGIVERLIAVFQLTPEQVAATWSVLYHFGNLSSATILFVLAELQQRLRHTGAAGEAVEGVAMAFGPGLVIEMVRLAYLSPPEAGNRNGTMAGQTEVLQYVGLA